MQCVIDQNKNFLYDVTLSPIPQKVWLNLGWSFKYFKRDSRNFASCARWHHPSNATQYHQLYVEGDKLDFLWCDYTWWNIRCNVKMAALPFFILFISSKRMNDLLGLLMSMLNLWWYAQTCCEHNLRWVVWAVLCWA